MCCAEKKIVVAIDGPAGSGKSTVSKLLARKLGFVHLNSGALFRALGYEGVSRSIALNDNELLSQLAHSLRFSYELDLDGRTHFFVNGADYAEIISKREAGEWASQVGLLPGVRQAFEKVQREVAQKHSIVVEGRDAGTVVFPQAQFKFYLEASPEVRAKRRYLELQEKQNRSNKSGTCGIDMLSLDAILEELSIRDQRDSTRKLAPQRAAEDAIIIDTSELGVEEVVDKIYKAVSE